MAPRKRSLCWSSSAPASYASTDSRRRVFSGHLGRPIMFENCRMPLTVARSQSLTGEASRRGCFKYSSMENHYQCGRILASASPFRYSSTDVHTVASLLKLYIRELPEPIIPFSKYTQFISCAQLLTKDKEMVIVAFKCFTDKYHSLLLAFNM